MVGDWAFFHWRTFTFNECHSPQYCNQWILLDYYFESNLQRLEKCSHWDHKFYQIFIYFFNMRRFQIKRWNFFIHLSNLLILWLLIFVYVIVKDFNRCIQWNLRFIKIIHHKFLVTKYSVNITFLLFSLSVCRIFTIVCLCWWNIFF